jgi:hypothetical protein
MKPLLLASLAATGLAVTACGASTPPASSPSSPASSYSVSQSALSPTSAPSSPTSGTTTPSPSAAASGQAAGCLSRYLHGATGLTQGAAGSSYVVITFKNLDNVSCTLYGFPGVALAAGTPVTDVGQPSTEDMSTARELVTLQPGGYANATLRIVDAGNFPPSTCTQVKTTWLAVIPPNQTIPLFIPWQSVACKGTAKLLSVTAVRPGNGGNS